MPSVLEPCSWIVFPRWGCSLDTACQVQALGHQAKGPRTVRAFDSLAPRWGCSLDTVCLGSKVRYLACSICSRRWIRPTAFQVRLLSLQKQCSSEPFRDPEETLPSEPLEEFEAEADDEPCGQSRLQWTSSKSLRRLVRAESGRTPWASRERGGEGRRRKNLALALRPCRQSLCPVTEPPCP